MSATPTGVILAAGMGTRLGELTAGIPKPLLPVAGRPLLDYGICWMRAAGVKRVVVVGGYRIEQLREFLAARHPDVILAENKEYATTQRMASLLVAAPHISGDLLVQDGDYIFTVAAAAALAGKMPPRIVLHGTRRPDACWSAMDVIISTAAESVTEIRKTAGTQPLGEGEYYFNSQIFMPASEVGEFMRYAERTSASRGGLAHVEDTLQDYIRSGQSVGVRPVESGFWVEVDNPAELEAARRFVAAFHDDIP